MRFMASKPPQPKGIGDQRVQEVFRVWRGFGIKAPPAERHWRRFHVLEFIIDDEVASKPPQPKGIGDEDRKKDLQSSFHEASKPPQPKGIGDINLPIFFACSIVGHQSPPSRKALETSRFQPHALSGDSAASKPPQPKGIGDQRKSGTMFDEIYGHQSPPSRKALETVCCFLGFLSCRRNGIKAPPAERHWRLHGAYRQYRRMSRWHQSPPSRKALETHRDSKELCLFC